MPRRQLGSPDSAGRKARGKLNSPESAGRKAAQASKAEAESLWDVVNSSTFVEGCNGAAENGWGGLGPDQLASIDVELSRESTPPAAERSPVGVEPVANRFGAVCTAIHDMLQMKYGLVLDLEDMVRKVEAHCGRNQAPDAADRRPPATTPEEVVARLNGLSELQFRTSTGPGLVSLRVVTTPLSTFAELIAEVRRLHGTAHTVAVVDPGGDEWEGTASRRSEAPLTAVAVFREDYGRRDCLVGRSLASGAAPLLTFGVGAFRGALALNPEVLAEFHCPPGSSRLAEFKTPPFREEYQNLCRFSTQKALLPTHQIGGGRPPAQMQFFEDAGQLPCSHGSPQSGRSSPRGQAASRFPAGASNLPGDHRPSHSGPPPAPPTPQFMSALRSVLESSTFTKASGEQAMAMLKQLASWLDADSGAGPHTVGEASRALDHVDLQHGLVRALTSAVSPRARTSGSVAELTVGVQAARCIGLVLRNSQLGAARFAAAGCVPALCDVLQCWPDDEDVQRTLVFAIRHIVDDDASAIEALYIGASRAVAAAAHRFPELLDLQTNSAQAIQLMAKHRETWIQRQHATRGGSQNPSPFVRPPSPPPNPMVDLHAAGKHGLLEPPPFLQMPAPTLFPAGLPYGQAPSLAYGGLGTAAPGGGMPFRGQPLHQAFVGHAAGPIQMSTVPMQMPPGSVQMPMQWPRRSQ